jgi:hypothetical protein
MDKQIYTTAYYSLFIQFILAIICTLGTFIKTNDSDSILHEVLILETIVQFIEFSFYIWLLTTFSQIKTNVSSIRYIDWFITTPTMLFSLICFMIYYNNRHNNIPTDHLSIKNIYNTNSSSINNIFIFNAVMLLTGLLGEINIINKLTALFLGTLSLFISFYLIYMNFVGDTLLNKSIFWFNFTLWSFYGIGYMLNNTNKNITYNILDIFAKNINGIMILFYILYMKYLNK